MFCAVRPRGGIFITVPQHAFLWSQADAHACHVRCYAARNLTAKVNAAGFQVKRMTFFGSLLLPLMIAERMRRPLANESYDPLAELKIGGVVNAVVEKIMDAERMAIRTKMNFAAGGSLLLIARKAS